MTTRITSENITDATITATDLAAGAGSTDWQAVIVADGSTVTTMVSGRGYFVNTSSAAGILKFPASASRGDYVEIRDYARSFGNNSLTIQRNGHNVEGSASDATIETAGQSVKFVYVDSTKGWVPTNDNTTSQYGKAYISATGGTITTSGDYKIHTFTGDGNFIVSQIGNANGGGAGVSYIVVAGGGGSGGNTYHIQGGGGGGAGGFRENEHPTDSYTQSPLDGAGDISVSAITYPITVGAGGTAGESGQSPSNSSSPGASGTNGSNSVFSSITSTGGGHGGQPNSNSPSPGAAGASGAAESGGSGGGEGGAVPGTGYGSGNTPPVSPPQGQGGGAGDTTNYTLGGGGGGAGAPGTNSGSTCSTGGQGGAGVASSITGSPVTYSHGGDSARPSSDGAGAANTGNGGNAAQYYPGPGSPSPYITSYRGNAGGKGVVILRYKYQN